MVDAERIRDAEGQAALDGYEQAALTRQWKLQQFSQWMTAMRRLDLAAPSTNLPER